MLDETELILDAMKKGKLTKAKKKTIQTYEDPLDQKDIIIEKLGKRELKKQINKKKPISKWSNKDFLIYFNEELNVRGSRLTSIGNRDSEVIARLYDKFVKILDEKMDNSVLRDYIDWWISVYLNKFLDRDIKSSDLDVPDYFSKFIQRFAIKDINIEPKTVKVEEVQDINKLYELSGLRMILLTFGIIDTVSLLKEKNEDWISKISSELQKLDKKSLINLMSKTVSKAPYDKTQTVDFISLAKDILRFHGVKDYQNVSYTQFFR